ncbi:hypothetical protein C0Q70_03081 [Pomacea canaliculata]|uniref:Uncharacterized protein n=1 Tax=Pomacea canaliculata TaxID=400727 RepID=A0A2T7PRR4_POMCA|nr:hypothetical protein C0Q70_03081 [Pomacea canaliculata]
MPKLLTYFTLVHVSVSQLEDLAASQPQKRSVGEIPSQDISYPSAVMPEDDDLDKRSSLFRFGKRSSLFRFGKRGSLFRFGKRGSLFRFGKRGGSLFRFGKRDDDVDEEYEMYPYAYLDDEDVKRAVKSFHWGREIED